jgi:hypothetical protein
LFSLTTGSPGLSAHTPQQRFHMDAAKKKRLHQYDEEVHRPGGGGAKEASPLSYLINSIR